MFSNYTLSSIYNIAYADFLQRVRSYNFLVALGACVFLIYSFVPALDAGYVMVSLGNYRGFYNSAWIGTMVANCVPFFALIGFYLVNYSVKRDVDTGVGQIIATTRITKVQYLSGKLMSNFAVLLTIMIVIAVMTIVMFLFRGETSQLEIGKLLLPLLILTVPGMFITAAIALFFDSLTGLSRGLINIVYFFLWIFLIASSQANPILDVFSMNTSLTEIKNSISATQQDWNGDSGTGILIRDSIANLKIFYWQGMNWTLSILLNRMLWMSLAFGLVLLGSLGFKRFDASINKKRKLRMPLILKKNVAKIDPDISPPQIKFRDALPPESRFSFFSLLTAEMRLMLKGNNLLWLIFTGGLFLTSAFAPIGFSYKVALPLIWFFQTLVLSKIGSREAVNRCSEYIFSSPFPLIRQLPATLAAASLIMFFLSLPVVTRLLFNGDYFSIYSIVVGALFIPAFAIALGILTGGSKLFEVIFTIIVYGYFNSVPYFDFTGAIKESHELGIANYLLTITFIMIIISFSARKRQIRHT